MSREASSEALYERWNRIATEGGNELALVDAGARREWTFQQLLRDSEQKTAPAAPVCFASGHSADFILQLLRAWRTGRATCPLEPGQSPPPLSEPPKRFAHFKLTSATTGAPKCIAFTAAQLAADPLNIVSTMGLRADWPNLACISLSHSYGFSNFVLPLVLHGIPLVILQAPLPEIILNAAKRFPAVTLPSVPALWRSWQESNSIPPNVAIAISAGAPLGIDLEKRIYERRGLKVHNFYGSSECGGIAYDRSQVPREEASFVGTPLDNVRLEVGSADTLVVQSTAVAQTYWPEPTTNLQAGRFETNDLAELTPSGVFLRGRASDLINVAGRKTSPEPIEAALRGHPSVLECIVFGSNPATGDHSETITACLNTSVPVAVSELTQFLSSRLPAWQIPRRWWFSADLLPNARGKLSRAEWRERYRKVHPL